VICSDATLDYVAGNYVTTGAPTEAALKILAEKIGAYDRNVEKTSNPFYYNGYV